MYSIDLQGKNGLILGVTNQRSVAWGIAEPLAQAGARLAYSYQAERLRPTLEKLTADQQGVVLTECDVQDDQQVAALFDTLEREMGSLDFVIHSLAYSPPETFTNPFVQTSRESWQTAMDVSAYSLVSIARGAAPLMSRGGSIVTLSYLAAERVVPHYNMMGVAKAALEASMRYLAYELGPRNIRVNAISAGPLRTVAARSISGFGDMYGEAGRLSMLKRNIDQKEVGGLALALVADALGSGITGETIYVDAGFNAIGMFLPEGAEV